MADELLPLLRATLRHLVEHQIQLTALETALIGKVRDVVGLYLDPPNRARPLGLN